MKKAKETQECKHSMCVRAHVCVRARVCVGEGERERGSNLKVIVTMRPAKECVSQTA